METLGLMAALIAVVVIWAYATAPKPAPRKVARPASSDETTPSAATVSPHRNGQVSHALYAPLILLAWLSAIGGGLLIFQARPDSDGSRAIARLQTGIQQLQGGQYSRLLPDVAPTWNQPLVTFGLNSFAWAFILGALAATLRKSANTESKLDDALDALARIEAAIKPPAQLD